MINIIFLEFSFSMEKQGIMGTIPSHNLHSMNLQIDPSSLTGSRTSWSPHSLSL